MKKHFQKAAAILLSISIVLSMIGCQSKQDASTKEGAQSTAAGANGQDADENGSENLSSEEPVNIRVASVYVEGHSMNKVFEEVLTEFKNDHPNVTITEEFMPSEQLNPKLKTDAASNNMPDIFPVWAGMTNLEGIQAGLWMNLEEELNKDSAWKDSFGSGTLEQVQYEAAPGYWAVPLCSFGLGFYYNTELFEKANAEPPKTWDELLQVIDKLKAIGVTPWEIGGKDTWRCEHLFSNLYYKMYGIDQASKVTDGSLKYDDESFLRVFEKMLELVDAGAFDPNMIGIDYAQEVANFASGNSGMQFNGAWAIGETDGPDTPDTIKGKVGFFPFPNMEGAEEFDGQWFGGVSDAFAVRADLEGQKKELVIELLKKITAPETAKKIGEESGNIPSVKTELDPEKTGALMPIVQEAVSGADQFAGDFTGFETNSAVIRKIENFSQAILGKLITPEDACKQLAEEAAR